MMLKVLKNLKLEQYIETFKDEGIDDLETFECYEDKELLALDLKKGHIKKIRKYISDKSMDNNEIIIKSWFKLLAENDDIWNHDVLQSNIPIITHEYKRIKDLLDSGNTTKE